MQRLARALCATLALSASTLAAASVVTNVYSGFGGGDGTPFSGLVGTLTTPGISFGTDTGFDWHPFGLGAFGSQSLGSLVVGVEADYSFDLTSDDGSSLYIDGALVIDNGGGHSPDTKSGVAHLTPGEHSFVVNFFEDFGGASGLDLALPSGVRFAEAVPEPATYALVLVALGAGAVARRRVKTAA